MEIQALRRLEDALQRFKQQHGRALQRQAQLSEALGKSREDMESLRSELQRYKTERTDTRKQIDTLLKRFEKLGLK